MHFLTQFLFLQFKFVVQRGKNGEGYVSLDEIDFREFEECPLTPPDAKPTTTTKPPTTAPPTTTKAPTTVPLTTTIEPTEPPDCRLHKRINCISYINIQLYANNNNNIICAIVLNVFECLN